MIGGTVEFFGHRADGRRVHRVTIGADGLSASVLTLGAVLQDVRLAGVEHSLTLGSDRLADYEADMRYHGALIGPVANRLSGAKAMVAGKLCRFEANQDGRHALHSGSAGSHLAVWDLIEARPDEVVLGLALADGAGGFPGNRKVTARFTALPPATLRLEISAETDAPTIFNATNHSYWNLDGTERYDGHLIQIEAYAYLPTDGDFVPTGEIRLVDGTEFDFRKARPLLLGQPPLDNSFCLSTAQMPLREILRLQGTSGVTLRMATTEPGVQIYDARASSRPGRGVGEGIAIETQGWPDAPNKAGFPSIRLEPGRPMVQVTQWRFARA